MKLLEITAQHRRDFCGTYECEFCGNVTKTESGYDDRNFHDNVIPNLKCKKCGKSTISEGQPIQKIDTKYAENEVPALDESTVTKQWLDTFRKINNFLEDTLAGMNVRSYLVAALRNYCDESKISVDIERAVDNFLINRGEK